ncbi:MAG: hypothetical protein JO144_05025 [Actinobacteria bacterium]|nr:hypothetical protein [Actinomycetota bacterium]
MPPARQVDLRLPLVIRLYVGAFLVLWVGMLGWTTIVHHNGPSLIFGVVFLVVGCAIGYRMLRLGVSSDADGALLVRNNLGSRRLTRDDVEEFRLGSNGGARLGQRGIQALLRNGTTFGLDVSRTSLGLGQQRLNRQLDELNAWLRGSRSQPIC